MKIANWLGRVLLSECCKTHQLIFYSDSEIGSCKSLIGRGVSPRPILEALSPTAAESTSTPEPEWARTTKTGSDKDSVGSSANCGARDWTWCLLSTGLAR